MLSGAGNAAGDFFVERECTEKSHGPKDMKITVSCIAQLQFSWSTSFWPSLQMHQKESRKLSNFDQINFGISNLSAASVCKFHGPQSLHHCLLLNILLLNTAHFSRRNYNLYLQFIVTKRITEERLEENHPRDRLFSGPRGCHSLSDFGGWGEVCFFCWTDAARGSQRNIESHMQNKSQFLLNGAKSKIFQFLN